MACLGGTRIPEPDAATAIRIAVAINTMGKAVMAAAIAGRPLGTAVGVASAVAIAAIGFVPLMVPKLPAFGAQSVPDGEGLPLARTIKGAVGQDAIIAPHRRPQISIARPPQGAAATGIGNVGLAKRVVSANHSSTGTASWDLR